MGATPQLLESRFYVIPVVLTAGAATAVQTTPAEPVGAYPFIWEELGAFWDTTNGLWTIRISDNGANNFFSSVQWQIATLVGVDQRPYELKVPWRFEPGSGIMVEALNSGGAGDTLTLLFIGRRLPTAAM
jgi:hypothetical protein